MVRYLKQLFMLYSFNHCATTAASKVFDVFMLLQTCQHIPDLFSVQVSFFHIVNPVGERLSWTRLQQGPDSSDIQSYYSVYAALYFFSTVTQQPLHPQLHSKSFTAWPKSSVTAKTRLWTRAWHVFHHYPTVPH